MQKPQLPGHTITLERPPWHWTCCSSRTGRKFAQGATKVTGMIPLDSRSRFLLWCNKLMFIAPFPKGQLACPWSVRLYHNIYVIYDISVLGVANALSSFFDVDHHGPAWFIKSKVEVQGLCHFLLLQLLTVTCVHLFHQSTVRFVFRPQGWSRIMVLENHNDNVNLTKSTLNGKGTVPAVIFSLIK